MFNLLSRELRLQRLSLLNIGRVLHVHASTERHKGKPTPNSILRQCVVTRPLVHIGITLHIRYMAL